MCGTVRTGTQWLKPVLVDEGGQAASVLQHIPRPSMIHVWQIYIYNPLSIHIILIYIYIYILGMIWKVFFRGQDIARYRQAG